MKSEQGFTLVELLLTMVLLGLIISLSFTIYTFGYKAYQAGQQRSHLQREVSKVARFITKELRNISPDGLSIINGPILEHEDDFEYIYLKNNGVVYTANGRSIEVGQQVISDLLFEPIEHDGAVSLKFTLDGFDGKSAYHIKSQVLLNNLLTAADLQSGAGIKYKKP